MTQRKDNRPTVSIDLDALQVLDADGAILANRVQRVGEGLWFCVLSAPCFGYTVTAASLEDLGRGVAQRHKDPRYWCEWMWATRLCVSCDRALSPSENGSHCSRCAWRLDSLEGRLRALQIDQLIALAAIGDTNTIAAARLELDRRKENAA